MVRYMHYFTSLLVWEAGGRIKRKGTYCKNVLFSGSFLKQGAKDSFYGVQIRYIQHLLRVNFKSIQYETISDSLGSDAQFAT